MTTTLARHRRADSDRRQDAVRRALTEMIKAGEFVTVSAVARRAGVHRSLIYRHPELQVAVDAAAATRHTPPQRADQVSTASLKVTAENERERNRRLLVRIGQLERRLSEALGREALHNTGFDGLDQTPGLEARIIDLEQDNAELRRQLKDTTAELEAAQHVNQQLTRQLNSTGHGRL